MKCKIDGCDRNAQYKTAQLCQMHYFRIRRNGTVEKVLERKKRLIGHSRQPRIVMPGKGYIRLYEPSHPLADTQGYVSEHRKVVYSRMGESLNCCELCGKPVTWKDVHIDHIDKNVQNNSPENLRPLCRPCNTFRDYPPQTSISGRISVTYNNETKTPEEWSRHPGVVVGGHVIRHRIAAGMSVEEALFSPKKTHNGKKPKPYQPITSAKHERKNSIAITIDGETKTAMEWSRDPRCSVSDGAIRLRIKSGWNPVEAVTTPAEHKQLLKELRK